MSNYNYNDREDLISCCNNTMVFLCDLQDKISKILALHNSKNISNLEQINSAVLQAIEEVKDIWKKLLSN